MKLGLIGLGKMGSRIALKLLQDGHKVVAWNRSDHEFKNVETIKELVKSLEQPRVIWLMLPQQATQGILDEVSKYVQANDIVIDGGNAFYKDTERRYETYKTQNIKFLGIGVSGGVIAAKEGYPLMVGGDKSAYEYVTPILDSLAKPHGGHEYFGTGGAGHFVKMIHNGIEYGIMQSLAEGFAVLHNAPYKLDLQKVGKLWQKGTLVSGFMLDRSVDALTTHPNMADVSGVINATGEAEWTIKQAKEEGVSVEIIKASLDYRKRSQTDSAVQNSFTAKMVAALRQAFGGHDIQPKHVK